MAHRGNHRQRRMAAGGYRNHKTDQTKIKKLK